MAYQELAIMPEDAPPTPTTSLALLKVWGPQARSGTQARRIKKKGSYTFNRGTAKNLTLELHVQASLLENSFQQVTFIIGGKSRIYKPDDFKRAFIKISKKFSELSTPCTVQVELIIAGQYNGKYSFTLVIN